MRPVVAAGLAALLCACESFPPPLPDPMDASRCPASEGHEAHVACLCRRAAAEQNAAAWDLYGCAARAPADAGPVQKTSSRAA